MRDSGSPKIRLEYGDRQTLAKCVVDRSRRLIFYPAVGRLELGLELDVDVGIFDLKVQVPMRILVVGRRTLPQGSRLPRGTYLEVVPDDAARFERICQIADGVWMPESGRSHPRVRVDFSARYFVPPGYNAAKVLDICPEGVFLRTDGPLIDVGKGVLVQVRYSLFVPRIELESRVCWVDRVESRRGMGLFCFGPARELRRLLKLSTRCLAKSSLPKDIGGNGSGSTHENH